MTWYNFPGRLMQETSSQANLALLVKIKANDPIVDLKADNVQIESLGLFSK